MRNVSSPQRGLAVPSSRLARLARFGGMAGGVAGSVAVGAAREWAGGRRATLGDLLMTPATAARVTRELANLRGAAMKMGQLLSMEAGDMLPPEMAEVMARLRSDAEHMPPQQLRRVLDRRWGRGWLSRFEHFEPRPVAAASIGQVHRARTRDGRDLAIKIQYPGVRESIDSDVRNVAALMRMAGVLPQRLNLDPLLAEARRQLHEEADYAREGAWLTRFGDLLAGDDRFRVPRLHEDFTTEDVLAMDYVEGTPVEAMADAPETERDRVVTTLLDLVLHEMFAFGAMQTDPNFANYRIEAGTGRIVLLDFGAAREIAPGLATELRQVMRDSVAGDGAAIRAGLLRLGVFDADALARHEDRVGEMIGLGIAALNAPGRFDFADRSVALRLRDEAMALIGDREFWHIPPAEILFVQRKLAGMYLLATRLKAKADLHALMRPWL
jgi:predicted unusual protein kinase regulating ubiquinone biosynthesis (AarF/ABC1/UbiB family)